MRWEPISLYSKIIVAISLISFVPLTFLIFRLSFASCYIDDGCGDIDTFVPVIVALAALVASLIIGCVAALIVKAVRFRK